jgi:hypothetical protein
VNSFYSWETGKIPIVKSQNQPDSMHPYSRRQPRIVHLNSRHGMRDEQFAPFLVDRQAIGKKPKLIFKSFALRSASCGERP